MWYRALVGALILALMFGLIGGSAAPQPAVAQGRDDFPVADGWFFSQANGKGGGGDVGYTVTNANGVPFWDWFNAFGGVSQVGYPVSHRFYWKGFLVQAFQKVVFQWRPEVNAVYFVNVFDELSAAGLNDVLFEQRATPPELDWRGDAGLSWDDIVARHLLLLAQNPEIERSYYDSPDPVLFNGLPMGYHDFGNVFVIRAQRKVFQQWRIDVPWARAGEVVVANGGDIGKEFGLYPEAAIVPLPPGEGQDPIPEDVTPTPTPTPPAQCHGDERMTFSPPNPVAGEPLFIVVTSERASANVTLRGPYDPQLESAGQDGALTVWTWRAEPSEPGAVNYQFVVENIVCTANATVVQPAPVDATPTPTGTPATPTPTATPTATPQP